VTPKDAITVAVGVEVFLIAENDLGSRGSLFSSGLEKVLLPETAHGGSGDLGCEGDLGVCHTRSGFFSDDSTLHHGRGIAKVQVHDGTTTKGAR